MKLKGFLASLSPPLQVSANIYFKMHVRNGVQSVPTQHLVVASSMRKDLSDHLPCFAAFFRQSEARFLVGPEASEGQTRQTRSGP